MRRIASPSDRSLLKSVSFNRASVRDNVMNASSGARPSAGKICLGVAMTTGVGDASAMSERSADL